MNVTGFDSERMLLSAVLQRRFDVSVVFTLDAEHFADPLHRRCFSRMKDLHSKNEPINLVLLTETMNLDGVETARLAGLLDPLLLATHQEEIPALVRNVKRSATWRRLQKVCGRIAELNGKPSTLDWLGLWDTVRDYREIDCEAGEAAGLESLPTGGLFTMHEREVEWLAKPLFARGLGTILDAPPKVGKTRAILEAIRASRAQNADGTTGRHFLSYPTKPIRAIYVSEQTGASLAMQLREVGFDGSEPIEELRLIVREHWSRFVFSDLLREIENRFLKNGSYNALVFDCWHTIARLENENDAAEVNLIGNQTIDVAARYELALLFGRHDRKSGGDVGQSGRSSIHLTGLMDVIAHLTRTGNDPQQRKLELIGRVPGLPPVQTIELQDGEYVNLGEPGKREANEERALDELLTAEPTVGLRTIALRTGIGKNRVKKVAETIGWHQDENGRWHQGKRPD